jgi:rod shape-determining protein MreB
VYDFEMTEEMIKNFLSQASKDNFFIKPKAIVAIPLETSPSEKKLIQETLEKCGIKETLLIYKNMADAIGCELPINKPVGFMIVDIGEGTTDISVISLGGIVIGKSIQVAGAQMTKDIVEYIKNKYGILIGENKAEDIKKSILSVYVKNDEENVKLIVKGRDIKTGNPTEINLTSRDCSVAIAKTIHSILMNINDVIEKTPAELATDIADNGIVLCGGGAYIKNIDYLISLVTSLPVFSLPDPELACIKGIHKVINDYDKYEHTLFKVL